MAFDLLHQEVDEKARKLHNRGAIAFVLLVLGFYLTGFGGTMTGLAYSYETKEGYTSLAEHYSLRCDIAGPVLLSVGGSAAIAGLVLLITKKIAESKLAMQNPSTNKKSSSPRNSSSSHQDQKVFTISGNLPQEV